MSNVKINYGEIVSAIGLEFQALMNEINSGTDDWSLEIKGLMSGISIFVDDEQSFVKRKDIVNNNIYIAVKFGNASTNFGSSVCPVNLVVFGSKNRIKPAQMLLSAFVAKFNLQVFNNNELISQIWSTPSVMSNFNTAGDAFESLFSVNGTLIIGQSVVKVATLQYVPDALGADPIDIDVMSIQMSYDASLSPQPFGNTHGFTESEVNFSTWSFTLSTYLLNNQFVSDCLNAQGFRRRDASVLHVGPDSTKGPNDDFKFIINFSNGYNNNPVSGESPSPTDSVMGSDFFLTFKLKSVMIGQKIGELPSLTVAFTH